MSEKCKCGCNEDVDNIAEEEICQDIEEQEIDASNETEDESIETSEKEVEEMVSEDEIDNESTDIEREQDYLKDLLRVQAEFDNYRKRMSSALLEARKDGFMDAIEQFLPAIDSFKMATDMITDKNTLMGIKFIEKGILDTLSKMGVEAIEASGEFNPDLHQAIDTDDTAEVESGMIVKEAYKGFTYKGKVIRYSQVIVNK